MVGAQKKTRDLPDRTNSTEDHQNIHYLPRMERYEAGKLKRKDCPSSSHAKWEP